MSDDRLVEDGRTWEALERLAGHDPGELPYPPDISERIETWAEQSGLGPTLAAITERIARTGESVEFNVQDGQLVYRFAPPDDDDPA